LGITGKVFFHSGNLGGFPELFGGGEPSDLVQDGFKISFFHAVPSSLIMKAR
jgi:hypothetical protein